MVHQIALSQNSDTSLLDLMKQAESRKFYKRKNNGDSEETGLLMEEIKLFVEEELVSSEIGKRKHRRLFWPAMALSFNFVVAVSIILTNKMVMGKIGFDFPVCLTLIHYVVARLILAVLNSLSILPVSPPNKSAPRSCMVFLGLVMALSSGLSNTNLKHNSVGFYQMDKIAVTPTVVLAEFIFFKKPISFRRVLALAIVSVGLAIATVTDLDFNIFGALIALAWIIPSAANKIVWSRLQQQGKWNALELMWKTTPTTVIFLLLMIPWLDPPGVLSFNWTFKNSAAIFTSAVFGFLLQWSGAMAIGATSAMSHVVLGHFKTCVILVGGYVIFGSEPGHLSICGAVIALCGMIIYTTLSLKNSDQTSSTTEQSADSGEKVRDCRV